MKVKLTINELVSVTAVMSQVGQRVMELASGTDASQEVLHMRLVAFQLEALAVANNRRLRSCTVTATHIKFNACTGLAWLSAWYAVDTTELTMNPLAAAVLGRIADDLHRAYAGRFVVQK